MEIYLDNAATTKTCPEAAEAAYEMMLGCYGNPSSTHRKGREAKAALDKARKQVCSALGCAAGELVFTSCGSESDNWAVIRGSEFMKRSGKHVITSAAEHDAVRKSFDYLEAEGFEVTRLSPGPDGAVGTEDVISALRPDTVLVSLMLVNNEVGAVTDIPGISAALKSRGSGALLHTDAVQAFMKIPFTPKTLGADMLSISGHKIHAPKGIGALWIRPGLSLRPYILGGAQENGRRAGTESLPLIAAFGAASEAAAKNFGADSERMRGLRKRAADRLTSEIPGLIVIGGGAPQILSISLPGYRSEVLMNFLESRNIFVSRSSACKKGGRSHVLEAMRLPSAVTDGALRIGISRFTTAEELDIFCDTLKEAAASLVHR